MAQFVSDMSFEDGVRGRYVEWNWPNSGVDDFYPSLPADEWILIKQLQINFSKIAVQIEIFNLDVIRERFGRVAFKIWGRQMVGSAFTSNVANLQANEVTSEGTFFMVSTTDLIGGNGMLLPPRAQLQSNIENDAFCTCTMFLLSSKDVNKLLKYM